MGNRILRFPNRLAILHTDIIYPSFTMTVGIVRDGISFIRCPNSVQSQIILISFKGIQMDCICFSGINLRCPTRKITHINAFITYFFSTIRCRQSSKTTHSDKSTLIHLFSFHINVFIRENTWTHIEFYRQFFLPDRKNSIALGNGPQIFNRCSSITGQSPPNKRSLFIRRGHNIIGIDNHSSIEELVPGLGTIRIFTAIGIKNNHVAISPITEQRKICFAHGPRFCFASLICIHSVQMTSDRILIANIHPSNITIHICRRCILYRRRGFALTFIIEITKTFCSIKLKIILSFIEIILYS